ncbi:hypothetical protein HaLaN_30199 [Haematococcus lacustris]|uniref:Uncharacterized protein n=1 Tax=Haematococcus lacustris TaxID=44745 RepID=A0A6A0AE87_HAELA|nr:hypothetical protein HaLaN_30199 [Haematococcus lacustris]
MSMVGSLQYTAIASRGSYEHTSTLGQQIDLNNSTADLHASTPSRAPIDRLVTALPSGCKESLVQGCRGGGQF